MTSPARRTLAKLQITLLTLGVVNLCGCASLPNTGSLAAPSVTPVAKVESPYVYMRGKSSNNEVLQFAKTSTGLSSPSGSLIVSGALGIWSVSMDYNAKIYVAAALSNGTQTVEVFPAGATGAATPLRTLQIAFSRTAVLYAVGPDGLLYGVIPSSGSAPAFISVYAATASGSDAPIRTLTMGPGEIDDMQIDPLGELVLTCAPCGQVNGQTYGLGVWAPGASGNDAPIRYVTSNYILYGASADEKGAIYAHMGLSDGTNATQYIVKYDPTGVGAVTPANIINLPSGTGKPYAYGTVRLDGAGNVFASRVYTDPAGDDVFYQIIGFPVSATGNAAPTSNFLPQGVWGPDFATN